MATIQLLPKTRLGERPYKCPQCPYSSSQKTHLTRHMRTHSGEKPFKCDQCNYVASNQHEVTRHARQVHNGPKPLTCPHCEYRTADRSNFKKHVELHVNPRQFLCPVCKYAASKKCNLQYHIKSKHPHCSDITMDVSKVKLRTKRLELDAPLAKMSKKMPDKLHLKRSENLDKKTSGKAEKTTAVAKEYSLDTSSKLKTRNHKAFSHKHLARKRDSDTEKTRKIKGTKRRRSLTVEGSVQQEPVNEAPSEVKRRKIGKAKELNEFEVRRKRIKLDKTSRRKNLKSKRVKKKSKKYIKADEHSTGGGADKCKKSDQPEQQLIVSKKKKDSCRNSSCSNNPSIEGTHKEESQNLEPLGDKAINKAPVCTVNEENENALNGHSAGNANKIVQKIARGSQTTFDHFTHPKLEEPMLTETLTVEETPMASTEHGGAFCSGQVECAARTPKTCSNSEPKGMSAESNLISDADQEKDAQVINIELAFEICNSNNSNDGQDGMANQDEGHSGMDDEMKVEDKTNKHILDTQDDQNSLQDDASKAPDALDDQNNHQGCTHKIQSGQQNQDQLQDDGDEDGRKKQEQNKKQKKDVMMEIDEDEGIHSHEGSETSEDSEGSDDSGLNGAKPTPDDKINKRTPEDVNNVPGNFVCIFCDRIFGVKGEFTKHLNRHLVNVYYLEEAAKNQG